jgi:hypothetical protein
VLFRSLDRRGDRGGTVGLRGGPIPRGHGAVDVFRPLVADLKDLVEELVELPHRYSPSLSM